MTVSSGFRYIKTYESRILQNNITTIFYLYVTKIYFTSLLTSLALTEMNISRPEEARYASYLNYLI